MPSRSFFRTATVAGMLILAGGCGDQDAIVPDFNEPELFQTQPTSYNGPVEALITFNPSGYTPDPGAPIFNLSTLPSTVEANHAWSRTISVDPNHPFAPAVAVDYGDGGGPRSISSELESFRLSHTYANAGTYTVKVAAQNTEGSRIETATITVTPDLSLYIRNFQITSPIKAGWPATFSFDAAGPGQDLYVVKTSLGDGVRTEQRVAPGGSLSSTYTWKNAGTYTLVIEITNGNRSATLSRQITVEDTPMTAENVWMTPELSQGDEAQLRFKVMGPGSGPYAVTIDWGDGAATDRQVNPGGTVDATHTYESGSWHVRASIRDAARDAQVSYVLLRRDVDRPYPTLQDVTFPATAYVDEETTFSLVLNDPTVDPNYFAYVLLSTGVRVEQIVEAESLGETLEGKATWTEVGEHPVFLVGGSDKNGLIRTDTFETTINVIERPDVTCDPGFYKNDYQCVPAPAGYFVAESGAEAPTACAEGTYQDQMGQIACLEAPPGAYVAFTAATEATQCEVGTFQAQSGATSCDPAPPGTFVAFPGAVQAIPCERGTYQAAEGSASCDLAPAGSMVPGVGATDYEVCAPGSFSASEGQASCNLAPVGRFVSGTGQTSAEACPVGTYSDVPGATSCKDAPAGSFVSITGAAEPTQCAPGTFQGATGSSACDPAPAGSFASGPGAIAAEACAAGTFSATSGQPACDQAPAGTYVASSGQTQATKCDVGYYQNLTGQTSCIPSPAGTYVSTTGASQPTACSAGTFQPNQGSYNCLDAEPGSYVSGPGAADDTPCALGTYQPQAGQTSCIAAPIGSYVDVTGARAATACPATTTTLGEGSTSATDCVSVGEVALTRVDQAVSTGGLVPADSGKGGTKAFEGWISDLGRSVDFLSGPQHQAGCVGVRNALAKADGRGSPKDAVTGPARAATADDLRWVLSENGCTGR